MIFQERLYTATNGGFPGKLFIAANQTALAMSAALATTYTGIGIYNPQNSGKLIVPVKVKFAVSAIEAALSTQGLIGGTAVPSGLTTLTVQNAPLGGTSTGVGVAFSAATIAAPVWLEHLLDANENATPTLNLAPTVPVYLDGEIALLPGSYLCLGALTAVTGLGSIAWAELPL